jgi:large subunit ribosomal protein L34e
MKQQISRKKRRIRVRTPGGNTKIVYKHKKPSKAVCSNCGDVLKGVPHQRPVNIKKLSKTQKRPERAYGGVLCSKCSRKIIIEKVRSK